MSGDKPSSGWRDVDYTKPLSAEQVARGQHRSHVGGMWETIGALQRDFLVERGLRPEHQLLDVGCGALRAGRLFVDYLAPGNYHGIDINETLLDAGYDSELSDPLRAKLPRDHLRATDRFECDFGGVTFDYAIAQSIFTHVSLNHIRLCLHQVSKVVRPGGSFFATFFEVPRRFPLDGVRRGTKDQFTERNVFFYYRSDLFWAASFSPWVPRYIGAWDHPRGQRMIEFRRAGDSVPWKLQRAARNTTAADVHAATARLARRVRRRLTG